MNKFGIKLAFIYLITLFSCKDNNQKGRILEKAELAKVMAELQILESQSGRIVSNSYDSTRVAFNYMKNRVFNKYHIDSSTFVRSFDYYSQNKNDLIDVYNQALETVDAMKKKPKK